MVIPAHIFALVIMINPKLFCCQMCSQSETCLTCRMASWPNTICIEDPCSVVFSIWDVGHLLHTSWTVMRRPLQDGRASRSTSLQFSFVLLQVRIFFYFGILNDGFYRPHKRCRGNSLYVRLAFGLV